jgi:hypothetical protein
MKAFSGNPTDFKLARQFKQSSRIVNRSQLDVEDW